MSFRLFYLGPRKMLNV